MHAVQYYGPFRGTHCRVVAACLQIGDASASQSPLSFGGFGSMLRHLRRLTDGCDAALQQDRLSKQDLKLLQVRALLPPETKLTITCLKIISYKG